MSVMNAIQAVRQNHALEHATIHVLTRRNPYRSVMGRSGPSGFVIYGQVSTEELQEAAEEALARLQAGEAHLAVHPRCGTNLAVTGLLVGTAAFTATLGKSRTKIERLPTALMAATLAALAAQPLALKVQQRVTTTPEVEGVSIAGVRQQGGAGIVRHKVSTRRA
jgi:uncharacterized protein YqhQ